MTIKIETLRCFCTVARTGNLADAATRLGRTQSAVSMTLKQLEAHLGQRLFESDRKNRLTLLGAQVYELGQAQLRRFDERVSVIETSARAPAGLLRIVSIPSVAGMALPGVIEKMSRRDPALRIEVWDTDTRQVIDALVQGVADIGIASGEHALTGVIQKPLFEDPFGLICAPGHPLARQPEAPTLDQVLSAGFVSNALCDQIEKAELAAAVSGARVTAHNTLSLITMIRTRSWVTILPRAVVQIMPNDLVFRRIVDLSAFRTVTAMLRERSSSLDLAREVLDHLSEIQW